MHSLTSGGKSVINFQLKANRIGMIENYCCFSWHYDCVLLSLPNIFILSCNLIISIIFFNFLPFLMFLIEKNIFHCVILHITILFYHNLPDFVSRYSPDTTDSIHSRYLIIFNAFRSFFLILCLMSCWKHILIFSIYSRYDWWLHHVSCRYYF